MKFAMMVLVSMLSVCYYIIVSPRAFAQSTTPTLESCGASDFKCRARLSGPTDASQDATIQWLIGQVSALERKVMSVGGEATKAEVESLQRQLNGLKGLVSDLHRALEEHKNAPHTTGPSPPDPSAAFAKLESDRKSDNKLLDIDGRLNRLADDIYAMNERLQGVERQLRRRAIRFDAGGFGLLSRGFMAAGGLGAITWPLGQDGDWAVRFGAGAGQGWGWGGHELLSVAWLAKADLLLYRWESFALGPTASLVGGTVRDGNRYLSWTAGATARVEPTNWLFVQASATTGAALGTYAPIQWVPISGLLEVGIPFL